MSLQGNLRLLARVAFFAKAAAAFAFLAGIPELASWLSRHAGLSAGVSGASSISPGAALSFVLAGMSLWLLQPAPSRSWPRRVAHGCAGAVLFLGAAMLFNSLVGPGLVSPETAVSFLLIGLGLLLLDKETGQGHWLAHWLAGAVFLLSLLAVFGHAYHTEELFRLGSFRPMRLYSAVVLLVLSGGVFCARPQRGLMVFMVCECVGGVLARRLLPLAIAVVLGLRVVQWAGQRAGLFDAQSGAAFLAASDVVVLSVLIVWEARWLHRLDTERRRAEQALRLRDSALRAAANVIVMTDRQGNIVWVNPAFTRLTGYTLEETLGRNPRVLKSNRHDEAFYRRLWKTILAGQVWQGEFINRRKNGTLYTEEATITPVKDEHGEITHFIAVKQDVTERKQAEEVLQRSERNYRQIFNSTHEAIFLHEAATGRLLDVNDAMLRLYGYKSREEVLTSSIGDLSANEPPYTQEEAQRRICLALEQGPQVFEWLGRKKNSERFWAEVSLRSSQIGGEGRILAVVRDTTDRKLLEQEARQSNERFLHIFQFSPLAISIATLAEGRILEVNESFVRMTGFSRTEMVGHNTVELDLWVNPEQRADLVDRARRQGAVRNAEVQFRTKTGERCDALLSAEPIELQGQSCLIFNIADITEKKKLEAQFLRAQRMEIIGTLASGIAHDLNNVLTPILMFAPLLRGNIPDEEKQPLLDSVEASAQRGASIVKQLLTFGRGLETSRVSLQVKHLIRDMASVIRGTFPKSVDLKTYSSSNLWSVAGDATQLHQVLLNLCVNARDAMPEGGQLILSAENIELDGLFAQANPEAKAGRYVLLTVADTGTGIPPDIQERIFDPFFTTKAPGQGTGLGLATVQNIARSHGGFIEVASDMGKGTQFKVFLPALETQAADAPAARPGALPRGQGELVLVVDDEAIVRQIIQRILQDNGYKVLVAGGGNEALCLCAQHGLEVKAVVSDMDMPPPAGRAVIRAFRQTNPKVKIVSISGHPRVEDSELDVDVFLAKPFTAHQLLETLRQVLARR